MRWMKHMTAAWQDEKIARMVDEGGIESYGFYWRMLEIVAANMTETSNPVCQLPSKSWARLCNLLSNRFERLSQLLAKCGLCRLDTFDGLLKVEFPNLVKYRDEYSKKRGRVDDKNPDKVRSTSGYCPEQEQIQKQKEKQNTETKHKQRQTRQKKAAREIDQEFLDDLAARYPRVNIENERALALEWIEDHPGRKMSRSFLRGWIDRTAKRIEATNPQPVDDYDGPFLNRFEEESDRAGRWIVEQLEKDDELARQRAEEEKKRNANNAA